MTTYINKEIAEKVAKQFLEEADKKIKRMIDDLGNLCISLYNQKIGPIVLSQLENLPLKWTYKQNSINFRSESNQYFYISKLSSSVFKSSDGNYCTLTNEEYEKISNLNDKIKKLQEKTDILRHQIVAQLLKLRSYSKIEKEFSEAFVFLPKEQEGKNLPVVNIKEILTSIKEL
jgi:hypothetical protein